MRVKITLVNGEEIIFTNSFYTTLGSFIENQLYGTYYTLSSKHNRAIRCSNILKVERLSEINNNGGEK